VGRWRRRCSPNGGEKRKSDQAARSPAMSSSWEACEDQCGSIFVLGEGRGTSERWGDGESWEAVMTEAKDACTWLGRAKRDQHRG
jgi:hypothetical protein